MSLSMYTCSIPPLVRNLNNLAAILQKGADHAAAKGIDQSVFISARLAPDMFPLARQIQITSDVSKGCAARLCGIEAPVFEDTESSFDELQKRITNTLQFLEAVLPEQADGSEDKEIVLKAGEKEFKFSGLSYLQSFVLPNVMFHTATAYNILRHNGVEIGKMDFLGAR